MTAEAIGQAYKSSKTFSTDKPKKNVKLNLITTPSVFLIQLSCFHAFLGQEKLGALNNPVLSSPAPQPPF